MKKGIALSLPKGWEIKKLDEVCEFGNGLWTGKKPPFQNVGVIRNTNFTKDGKLDDSDIVYLDVEQSQFAKRKLQYGDIILEKSGGGPKQPVGRVIIFDKKKGDFSFSNFTSVIRIVNPKTVDFNYLHRFLFFSYVSGATETMQSHSTGIRNLKFDDYKAIKIPLPALPEQQRIVSILDEAFAAIAKAKANAEQNLKNAKELFESYLQGVFENGDWERKKWGELCEFVRGPFGGSLKKNVFKEDGYVVYEQKHAIHDHFNQLRYFIDEYKFNEMKRFELFPGDIIMSCSGVTLGRVAIVPDGIKRGIINQALLKLTPKKNVSVHFIKHWLRSSIFQKIIFDFAGGAAIPNVPSAKILKDILIPFPSLKEQEKIVNEIEMVLIETKKLQANYQQKINDLEELKKSVLQKAFSGELRGGEPVEPKTEKK
jgi:type I restriction enzyme S subunit